MSVAVARAPGRPRSSEVTARVQAAARAAFSERGFGPVTMSDIATAAGVGLDSIYRRWPSKQALLVDVVATAVAADVRVPDSGDLGEDLRRLLRGLVRAVAADLGTLLAIAVAEAAQDPVLAARLAGAQEERRRVTSVVIERAVARGQLPGNVDGRLLLDTLAGLVWQRAWLTRAPLTDAEVDASVAGVLGGHA